MQENQVNYTHTNTYSTLNSFSEKTRRVWLVFHGMGHLTRYFIKHFEGLDPLTNYLIAPQAQAKYYQDKKFKYVGASWLTKENTLLEKENVFRYLDAVWAAESAQWENQNIELILLGYSQGVSIVTRWSASRKIKCAQLILHSGGIPKELKQEDFDHLDTTTKVTYLYGNRDEYIDEARKTEEQLKGTALFGEQLEVKVFDGVHEVCETCINEWI